ncbi:MAG: hypothetical protein QM496_01875 [Verrucomicrobiota bacterium]
MATNNEILQALSPSFDIDLNSWKVALMGVELPPLAVDQSSAGGEFPAKVVPVNDVLQSNYASLEPKDTRDLVVNAFSVGDSNAPFGLGFRRGGELVAAAPTEAILQIVEFVGERPVVLNDGSVAPMSDAEGVRYRMMLDLTAKRLRSLVEAQLTGETAFLDAKCVIKVAIPYGLTGAAVAASSDTFDMTHNQSTPGVLTINLPDQANSTTVSYDVQVVVNIPASDYLARYAVINTTIDVTRNGSGVFTAAVITGDTSATGEAFPAVDANQRTFSDYKHTLGISAAVNGSSGIVISSTVDTEDYTNVRAIDMVWSSGVSLDGVGRLSANQKFDIWYNGVDTGHTNWITTSNAAWRGYSIFETWMLGDIAGATTTSDLDFKMFADNAGATLVLKPADLANNFSADFDKFSLKLQEAPGSNFVAANWDGGAYPGSFVSAVVTEPAPGAYDVGIIRRKTQPFILRIYLGLDR